MFMHDSRSLLTPFTLNSLRLVITMVLKIEVIDQTVKISLMVFFFIWVNCNSILVKMVILWSSIYLYYTL